MWLTNIEQMNNMVCFLMLILPNKYFMKKTQSCKAITEQNQIKENKSALF